MLYNIQYNLLIFGAKLNILLSEDSDFEDASVTSAIDLKLPLEIRITSLLKKTQDNISKIFSRYLASCGLSDSFSKLDYCLSEILSNAVKANVKRIYFKEKNLDINNTDDYVQGMRTFKMDTFENKAYYFEKLRDADKYINLSLHIEENNLIIEVRNNSVITLLESERVKEKISNFHTYSAEELALNFVDETEGSGLGINSIMLMLKNLGLPEESYQIYAEEHETVAKLVISV